MKVASHTSQLCLGSRVILISATLRDLLHSCYINIAQSVQIQKSLKKYQLPQGGNIREAVSSSITGKSVAKLSG